MWEEPGVEGQAGRDEEPGKAQETCRSREDGSEEGLENPVEEKEAKLESGRRTATGDVERLSRQRCYVHKECAHASRPSAPVVPLGCALIEFIKAVVAVGGSVGPGITRLMCSSESTRSVLPFVTLAPATGVELGIAGSWASTVAASAVSRLALASFAFALTLGRGRVEGATSLKVVPMLVVVGAPGLFGRIASNSTAVRAMGGDVARFTTGIAGLVHVRRCRTRASARTLWQGEATRGGAPKYVGRTTGVWAGKNLNFFLGN